MTLGTPAPVQGTERLKPQYCKRSACSFSHRLCQESKRVKTVSADLLPGQPAAGLRVQAEPYPGESAAEPDQSCQWSHTRWSVVATTMGVRKSHRQHRPAGLIPRAMLSPKRQRPSSQPFAPQPVCLRMQLTGAPKGAGSMSGLDPGSGCRRDPP